MYTTVPQPGGYLQRSAIGGESVKEEKKKIEKEERMEKGKKKKKKKDRAGITRSWKQLKEQLAAALAAPCRHPPQSQENCSNYSSKNKSPPSC